MIENMNDKSEIIKSLEIAGSIHKKVRTDVKKIIKPGIKLFEIAELASSIELLALFCKVFKLLLT